MFSYFTSTIVMSCAVSPLHWLKKRVADAVTSSAVKGIALGHDGHIGLAALQIHHAVGKALRLDERFQLGFKRDIADAVTQLGRQLLLLLAGQLGILQGLFQSVQRLIPRLAAC